MRSKLVGVIVVLVVAVSFSVACQAVVNHAAGNMEALSMEAQRLVDEGRKDDAVAKMVELATEWKRHQPFLEMLISHSEMYTVAEWYTEASIDLQRGQLDDYYKAMALLQEMLDHIREQERIRWGNIL